MKTMRLFILSTLIFSLSLPIHINHLTSLSVNSLADSVAADGQCTLREAIQNTNNNAATNPDCPAGSGADMITFSISGTISLASALPNITDTAGLTIDAANQIVTISGNNLVNIFYVHTSVPLTLNQITIADGRSSTYGAAIDSYGTLAITGSTFSGNSNTQYDGGAIYNHSGVVTIDDSTFSGNTAADEGGGIYSLAGKLTITGSTFTDNTAFEGGGIYSHDCTLEITNSNFTENYTPNGSGGGIYNAFGPLTLTGSTLSGNGASYGAGGGGIHNHGGTLTISATTFSGNSAAGSPGGAIFSDDTLDITTSTFTSNSAGLGGGIYTDSTTSTISNSTFSGNNATTAGTNGGAVYTTNKLTITNTTIAANTGGGGVGNSGGTLTLRNTILANNSGGNCSGTITNGAANIDDGTTCGWGTANGSMSSTDPLLGSLSGSPAYFPLNPGSPAVDKGDDSICAASPVNNQSQNGVIRPQGSHCDIGSYEQGDILPPQVVSITRFDPNPTTAASVRFTVTFSEAATGVDSSDFNLTLSGVTGASISAVSGSGLSYTVTVSTGSDTGTIRLDLEDDDSILDLAANPLGGPGLDNGSYTTGETYQVRYPQIDLPLIFRY